MEEENKQPGCVIMVGAHGYGHGGGRNPEKRGTFVAYRSNGSGNNEAEGWGLGGYNDTNGDGYGNGEGKPK